ncbi:MAG: hypothetical protein COZ56_02880 [Armatimonadetes bacterium CG_4_8_14_3_um_filter_58_9]|nr:MAG: hypothetical protein COZ56_02880 [Armatimonadetes bacterium CG_4_8_14_3_um_filter_58_9]PJB75807.1 MAG: hypothetical protein CO095_03400 [Armatimonadetes bacterium CG_4_9_14_3_um_filter_58_7]
MESRHTSGPVIVVAKEISYAFPFGIGYLVGYLKERGEDVRVLFRPEDSSRYRDFARQLIAAKPLLVGFGSLYPDLYPVRDIIRLLDEEKRDFPVVVGGQMVTPTPEFAVEVTGADAGVLGEGEIIFHELVTALREGRDATSVKGLVLRVGSKFYNTGPGEYLRDLSALPPVPYELFPVEKWINVGRQYVGMAQPHWRYNDRVISVHGGRGCPFQCNFCYHHSKARYRPLPQMMEEAERLLHDYGANMLYFGDALVLANPKRARELTALLRQFRKPVEYSVSSRFDILSRMDDALLQEMRATGCRIMGLGIESGSQRILDLMHKKITVEEIVTGLRRLKAAGILPTVSIMVGQYTETDADVQMSMDLMVQSVRENKNIEYAFTIATGFPGTELYDLAFQRGLLSSHRDFFDLFDPTRQICNLTCNLSAMTDDEVLSWHQSLQRAFKEEKAKATGKGVARVESARRFTARVDSAFRRRIVRRLPARPIVSALLKPYEIGYDATQTILDHTRLRMLEVI